MVQFAFGEIKIQNVQLSLSVFYFHIIFKIIKFAILQNAERQKQKAESKKYDFTRNTPTVLDFFKSKEHLFVPSAPIVLKDDPTLMFSNSGMTQFKDYFLGYKEPNLTELPILKNV